MRKIQRDADQSERDPEDDDQYRASAGVGGMRLTNVLWAVTFHFIQLPAVGT